MLSPEVELQAAPCIAWIGTTIQLPSFALENALNERFLKFLETSDLICFDNLLVQQEKLEGAKEC